MKYKVNRPFYDTPSGKYYNVGDVAEFKKERTTKINTIIGQNTLTEVVDEKPFTTKSKGKGEVGA